MKIYNKLINKFPVIHKNPDELQPKDYINFKNTGIHFKNYFSSKNTMNQDQKNPINQQSNQQSKFNNFDNIRGGKSSVNNRNSNYMNNKNFKKFGKGMEINSNDTTEILNDRENNN